MVKKPNRNRDILMAFFVSKDEREKIKQIAAAHDMTFSDYTRKVLLGKIPNDFKQER